MTKEMNKHLKIDKDKIETIAVILTDYLKGNSTYEESKEKINSSFDKITAQEFALCEQYLDEHGIDDDLLTERIEEVIGIVEDVLVTNELHLESGHPIDTYLREVEAIRGVLEKIKELREEKFIKNEWLDVYDKLKEIKTHFARKQNQLFPALEKRGFDKPTKIMWTLDNNIEENIRTAIDYLNSDKEKEFLDMQEKVIDSVEDMMEKEENILYPTAMDLLEDKDFIDMRQGDDEIGYALIDTPPSYKSEVKSSTEQGSRDGLLDDLKDLLVKYGESSVLGKDTELDVSQGKLTLEQINLIFKHMQVDLSYVDENEISKFYTDTEHRIFPRSPGVIGRRVENCHPKESVYMVKEIIDAFRSGEQDEAEFWLEVGESFIYIKYNAVRDEDGKFRGVLETMQDVTRIRQLEGSKRLLSWEKKDKKAKESIEKENPYGITSDTLLGELVKTYPYIKDYLTQLSPKYEKLKNPIAFKTMSKMATLDMISKRGNMTSDELIDKIVEKINLKESK